MGAEFPEGGCDSLIVRANDEVICEGHGGLLQWVAPGRRPELWPGVCTRRCAHTPFIIKQIYQ